MKNKLKLTTTTKASTKMLYDLIQVNATLTQVIKDQQKAITHQSELIVDLSNDICKEAANEPYPSI
jgi:hypothetical protein